MTNAQKIYLDYQATCPLDERVFAVMSKHFKGPAANPHSAEHSFGWQAAKTVLDAQEQVGALIGADADEIIFTSGATEANNLALRGRDYANCSKLVVSSIDHKCVLETARSIELERGVEIARLDVDEIGVVRLDQLKEFVDKETALVSVIGVNNEIGTIQPLEKISEIVRAAGAKLHLDLAQAPMAIDLSGLADLADSISLSAHKFYGPMGIGCLYIARNDQLNFRPQITGGGQQGGLRSGTVPVALAAGMGKAAELILSQPQERGIIRRLNKELWAKLQALPFHVELNGPSLEARHPSNLNVSFLGYDGRDIIGSVQPALAISSGAACTTGVPESSYVLSRIGLSEERLRGAIRISIGRYTTQSEIEIAANYLCGALKRLKAD
ncbi:aminotransferase class V-fold PLP-dependent enzyme [Altererythrobacter luteolus]|uniref:Cysteine desulfurase n=1 Tax=Pontixanthobacter luteolus TaxID=295089 RepID=A0A6I4V217_9SPHN|nr:cysteine desulfurase family protein [Pontixanthobacter luteolus]MXP48207.1 aminotransferase class V-fold PLP-dependent enzyme [Pontixanthobacter luteolus]